MPVVAPAASPELPYRVERTRLVERAMTLRLAALVADCYRDPSTMVTRAAAASRYLVTVSEGAAVVGFMFTRVDPIGAQRAACLTMIGLDATRTMAQTALPLLRASDELFDASVELCWTTTTQARLVRTWAQHFARRTIADVEPVLATALWSRLGATPEPGEESVCRGAFDAELSATTDARPERWLLVARRR